MSATPRQTKLAINHQPTQFHYNRRVYALKTATGHVIAEVHGGADLAHKMAAAEVMFEALQEIEIGLHGAGHSTATPEQCAGGTCHYCATRRRAAAAIAAAIATKPLPIPI